MLPRKNRVLTGFEFRQAFKSPVRTSTSWASLHLVRLAEGSPTTIGFVVSGAVGNAVVRNLVKRRLRAASREFLIANPYGWQLVVRARPGADSVDYARMKSDLDLAAERLFGNAAAN